jgi:tetratricopeptide (TPR) repeat protein
MLRSRVFSYILTAAISSHACAASQSPVEVRLDQARAAVEAGALGEAARLYQEILADSPGRPEALLSLAMVAVELGDRERARGCYRTLLEDPEERSDARFNLALMDRADGRLAEAVVGLAAVVAERPDYPAARLALGEVLVEAGRGAEAEPQFAAAGELVPDDPYPLVARARIALGRKDRKAALGLFERAARVDPESAAVLEEQALVLESDGQEKEARQVRQAALERARIEPGPEGFFHRSQLAIGIGDLDRARSELRGCLALDPGHAGALALGERLLGREGLRSLARAREEAGLLASPPGRAP